MELLGINSVPFVATDQLLIRFFAVIRFWEKNGSTIRQYINFKKAYKSARREVLYNILIEFRVPMILVWLIKLCLNETCSKVCTSKQFSDSFLIQNDFLTRRRFITTAFLFFFRICH
jgi:hypothetical protein